MRKKPNSCEGVWVVNLGLNNDINKVVEKSTTLLIPSSHITIFENVKVCFTPWFQGQAADEKNERFVSQVFLLVCTNVNWSLSIQRTWKSPVGLVKGQRLLVLAVFWAVILESILSVGRECSHSLCVAWEQYLHHQDHWWELNVSLWSQSQRCLTCVPHEKELIHRASSLATHQNRWVCVSATRFVRPGSFWNYWGCRRVVS